jgi:ubiquinone/menaquinone biosynthesis C-methylase UbiE
MPLQVVGQEMRSYYDQRAPEYDDWWNGTGKFVSRVRPGWEAEVAELVGVLAGLEPAHVLDVACGTGFLTRHLRGEIVALDQSARMLEVAGARMPHARMVQGDAVPLPFADGEFDRLVTGHFYGHLLPKEREAFVAEARRVAREVVVVDSAFAAGAPEAGADAEEWQERVLNDGSSHEVYKRYFDGAGLAGELGGGEVLHDGSWFVVVRA